MATKCLQRQKPSRRPGNSLLVAVAGAVSSFLGLLRKKEKSKGIVFATSLNHVLCATDVGTIVGVFKGGI